LEQAAWAIPPQPSIRYNQEFAGDQARTYFTHLAISGLDFLISMRNDQWNTSHSSLLFNNDCNGITPEDPTLTAEVLEVQHTRTARYGSKVRSAYSADLKINLYRAAELGLADYAFHVSKLTPSNNSANPPSVSDLNTTQKAYNVYYGAHKESNPTRQYRSRTASIAMAVHMPINDILIVDKSSYFARNASGFSTASKFHSKIFKTPDDGTSFYTYCYKVNGVCTEESTNAGVVIFATHPNLNDVWQGFDGVEENQFVWRSRGGLFSSPPALFTPQETSGGVPDYDQRRIISNQVVPEFVNALYYRFDGLNSLAVKQAGSDIRYLPNQIIDAFSTAISWNGDYDGRCYSTDFVSGTCDRVASNFWIFSCEWEWPAFL